MNPNINRLITRSAAGIILATCFLFPLFFLPITPNWFETNKLVLLMVATALLLVLWSFRTVVEKTFRLTVLPFAWPLLALGVLHLITSFYLSPKSPAEALMGRGSFFLILALFVTASGDLIDYRQFVKKLIYALVGSGTLLSLITIMQSFGLGLSNLLNRLLNLNLTSTIAFTPAGSVIALLSFLLPVLTLSLFMAFTKKEALEKITLFVFSAIMTAALVVLVVYSLPGKDTSPIFLPFKYGYMIAIDILKSPKTAILGVGPAAFISAYSQLRPTALNMTELWNLRFSSSTNELFQMLTTAGLLGVAGLGWLVMTMINTARIKIRSTQVRALKVVALGTLILFVLIPGSLLMYFSLAIILLGWGIQTKLSLENRVKMVEVNIGALKEEYRNLRYLAIYTPVVLVLVTVLGGLYFMSKAYGAEMVFNQAIAAATKNDGVKIYDLQRQAIIRNPYLPRYRRAYSATNLALANALAGKKELTEEDKKNVSLLVQQAIREAKVAVNLEPQNVTNWENLVMIYRSLISSAKGADQWTIAALSQAIQTDPTNPQLRLDLGGVYYSLGSYDQAIRLFQQAIELKPNLANAYYNLSHAYLQKKEITMAYDYLRQVITLTKVDSADYAKAKQELEELAKQLPKTDQLKAKAENEQAPAIKTELNAPLPVPSPTTQVELPQNMGPESVAPQTAP